MTQTLNSLSWANCKIELSADGGTTWKDISGFANSVTVDGGERAVSEFMTVTGDTPIVTSGKRSLLEVTVKAVYTEDTADAPFIMGLSAYESATDTVLLRWSPKGGAIGDYRYATSAAKVVAPVYPQGAADSGDAIPVELKLKCASITKSVISV